MAQPGKGTLYLIPSTLGESAPFEVLPISIKKAIERIDHYIVENEKSARHFIKKIDPRKAQPSLHLFALNKFTETTELPSFLEPCENGMDMGLISEAGCPAIADPGAVIVAMAHERRITVVPLVGPSSIILGLMASGMDGQNFAFNGYLPIEGGERKRKIKQLEKRSKEEGQTQLFIETPYRNNRLLEELQKNLLPTTRLCVAADLTLPTETILTQTAEQWSKTTIDLHKRPTIFSIQA
jgi:16S rRNA (cytidine1402-2'-O)-methyltransferase